MCNFDKFNVSLFGEADCWPEDLDWLGFDIYGFDTPTTFDAPRDAIEWNLFGRMSTPSQYVMHTTVGNGGHTPSTSDWTLEQYDDFCASNAKLWFEYARTEPRLGGVFPWYWRTGSVYPPGGINVTYGLGLDSFPSCRAAFEEWGGVVRAATPGGRILPHGHPRVPGNRVAGCF